MSNNIEQKQDINQTSQVPSGDAALLKNNQKAISNEIYMQKLIENFGYSVADLEYADQPPPPYSELSMPLSAWKHQYAKSQIVTLSKSKPNKSFLFLCIIYFIRNVFEAILGLMLASMSDYFLLFTIWPVSFIFSGIIILYIACQRSSETIDHTRHIHLMLLFLHIMYLLTILFILDFPNVSIVICPLFSTNFCLQTASSCLRVILMCMVLVGTFHDLLNVYMAYIIHYKTKLTYSTAVF